MTSKETFDEQITELEASDQALQLLYLAEDLVNDLSKDVTSFRDKITYNSALNLAWDYQATNDRLLSLIAGAEALINSRE